MKHKINKMAAIFIATIFALSGLGIVYAAWTDTITIDGTVTTGSLCWEFANCGMHDDDEPIDPGGDHPTDKPDSTCDIGFLWNDEHMAFYWDLEKNVAWGECVPVDTDGDLHNDQIQVTLHNAYPCYFNELTFYVHSYGTIPLRIDHIKIGDEKFYGPGNADKQLDLDGDGQMDIEIQWKNCWGYQLHYCKASPEISLWLHVLQPCPQGQVNTLTFTIDVVAIQWNEYPSGP